MAFPLKRMAAILPLSMLGGAGISMYTSGEPYFSLYQPTSSGQPSIAMKYLNAYREGMRPMTQAAEGYGTGKFGGVKTADWASKAKTVFNMPGVASDILKFVGKHKGWAVPALGGAIAFEALDPLSDVFKPVATAAGERMSERFGLTPTPMEQTLQKGIDALAIAGAKELASGVASGIGAGGRAGVGLLRRPASFESMMQGDPVLSQAPPTQMPLLQQSYEAMQRVAPRLSQEPFVTKNFLRDIMVTDAGPDHATLSSLARSEQTIADAQGSVWGGR